eukprot:TRINITY_DN1452_c2_g2_i1.p1 TRINITY_DN1452_c2_g2~~TRINITY_DN1452_c2_g2_i1.p1  ORF type:complete len:422 (-),score=35.60 TRINITY_DN1452_c2_g2_i1:242-1438(-)
MINQNFKLQNVPPLMRITKKINLFICLVFLSATQNLAATQTLTKKQLPSNDKNLAKIAYFLNVSKGESEKAIPLLKKIITPENIYILHMDEKMSKNEIDKTADILDKLNATHQNIHFLPQFQESYLGITLVDIELTAMATALSISKHWTHYINLSPSDYPLLTQKQLQRILGQFPKNISFMKLAIPESLTVRKRFTRVFFDDSNLGYGDNIQNFTNCLLSSPENLKILKGSWWNVLSREVAEFFAYSSDGWARRMLLLFGNALIPDEYYFQTTICSSLNAKNLVRSAMTTYVNCKPKYLIEKREPGKMEPSLIHEDLLEEALKQGALFARKFGVDEQGQHMKHLLDELHDGKEITLANTTFTKESVYKNAQNYFYDVINHGRTCDDILKKTNRTQAEN